MTSGLFGSQLDVGVEGEGRVKDWDQGVLEVALGSPGGKVQLIFGYTGQEIDIQRQQQRGG